MSRIKTIIVDDESLARKRIKKLLATDESIHLVNEFDQGIDAISFIENHHVDLVFLDIHMPEIDGFTVLKKLSEHKHPFIIFATADKDSAIKAFEYYAIGYLLKPFRNIRFYDALESAKSYIKLKRNAEVGEKFANLAKEVNDAPVQKIEINKEQTIDFDDVIYISSEGNYLKVFQHKDDFILIRKTMSEIEQELNSTNFLRIHRSIIINKYFIQSINYSGNNEYLIQLTSEIELKSSRSYKETINRIYNKK